MQCDPPTPPAPKSNHQGISIIGLILFVGGLFLARQLIFMPAERATPRQLDWLIFFGPVLVVLGGAMIFIRLLRFASRFKWLARAIPPTAGKRLQAAWRIFIWLMVTITLYPYWWLDILTRLKGERPGNEGEGMMGFLIILFPGLPSLALAIFNEARLYRNRGKEK